MDLSGADYTYNGPTQPTPSDDELPIVVSHAGCWGYLESLSAREGSHDLIINEITIGRSTENTISVTDPRISKVHCKISRVLGETQGNNVYLQDVSTNGTFVNRKKVGKGKHTLLVNGDTISLTSPNSHSSSRLPFLSRIRFFSQNISVFFIIAPIVFKYVSLFGDSEASKKGDLMDDIFEKKYLKYACLGTGSFAQVYVLTSIETLSCFAGKIIDKRKLAKKRMLEFPGLQLDPSTAESGVSRPSTNQSSISPYLIEHEMMKCVNDHPNIIQTFEAFEGPYKAYIIMEMMNQGDLLQMTMEKALSEMDAFLLFYQTLSAVAFCHYLGIVHRDIKPDNIFFKKECISEAAERDIIRLQDRDIEEDEEEVAAQVRERALDTDEDAARGSPTLLSPSSSLPSPTSSTSSTSPASAASSQFIPSNPSGPLPPLPRLPASEEAQWARFVARHNGLFSDYRATTYVEIPSDNFPPVSGLAPRTEETNKRELASAFIAFCRACIAAGVPFPHYCCHPFCIYTLEEKADPSDTGSGSESGEAKEVFVRTTAKLGDFGVARFVTSEAAADYFAGNFSPSLVKQHILPVTNPDPSSPTGTRILGSSPLSPDPSKRYSLVVLGSADNLCGTAEFIAPEAFEAASIKPNPKPPLAQWKFPSAAPVSSAAGEQSACLDPSEHPSSVAHGSLVMTASDQQVAHTTKLDMWSLGVVLYMLLSRAHPFIGNQANDFFLDSSPISSGPAGFGITQSPSSISPQPHLKSFPAGTFSPSATNPPALTPLVPNSAVSSSLSTSPVSPSSASYLSYSQSPFSTRSLASTLPSQSSSAPSPLSERSWLANPSTPFRTPSSQRRGLLPSGTSPRLTQPTTSPWGYSPSLRPSGMGAASSQLASTAQPLSQPQTGQQLHSQRQNLVLESQTPALPIHAHPFYHNLISGRPLFQESAWANVSAEAIDLVKRLLQFDPEQRISAAEALQHPWCKRMILQEDDRKRYERQAILKRAAILAEHTREQEEQLRQWEREKQQEQQMQQSHSTQPPGQKDLSQITAMSSLVS